MAALLGDVLDLGLAVFPWLTLAYAAFAILLLVAMAFE
jgi:hypothetical protein